MPVDVLSSPVIQYGFAGFCVILLAVVVWLIDKVTKGHDNSLKAYKEASAALIIHTQTLSDLKTTTERVNTSLEHQTREFLSRPCISQRK